MDFFWIRLGGSGQKLLRQVVMVRAHGGYDRYLVFV
jgi:hypothetical protein